MISLQRVLQYLTWLYGSDVKLIRIYSMYYMPVVINGVFILNSYLRVTFLTRPVSCTHYKCTTALHSALRYRVLVTDAPEWLHRTPQLIFRLYDAIWDCFTDIQRLLHLGNEKNALFKRPLWKHSAGQRRWFGSKSHSWTSWAESLAFYSLPSQRALQLCVACASDRADL